MVFRGFVFVLALAPVFGQNSFIAFHEPVVALVHVRVIDGTGAPARADQAIVIDHGNITAVGNAGSVQIPAAVRQLDLAGHTVYPGLIGMHEHLFYPSFYPPTPGMPLYTEQAFSAPRLYLASGVTTMRTTGSLEPYTDLNLKKAIDAGTMPGPAIDVTGPTFKARTAMPSRCRPSARRRRRAAWSNIGRKKA